MKYLLFGDIHGRSLYPLLAVVEEEEPDALICTGDFGSARAVRQFMEIPDSYEKLVVPGNHDYAVFNSIGIKGTVPGRNVVDIHKEFRDEKVRNYLGELLEEPEIRTNLNGFSTLIVHGALAGQYCGIPCPDQLKNMWFRLEDDDYRDNFEVMSSQLMVRGHDHEPQLACWSEPVEIITPEPGKKYLLDRPAIITVGAYLDGWVAFLEDDIRYEKT